MNRTILKTYLLILLLLLAACSSDPLDAGRDAMTSGDFDTAIAEFSSVLDGGELSAEQRKEALSSRSMLHTGQNNFDAAQADILAALAITEGDSEAVVATAEGLVGQYSTLGEWEEVITVADAALAVDPANSNLLNARGEAHLELRNFDQAITDLKASLQGEVDAAQADASGFLGLHDAYFRLGRAMLDVGEYDEAVNAFTESYDAASGNAEEADALAERGFAYSENGQTDAALADFDQAIALNPDLAIGYAYRSYAFSAQENYEAAISDANRAVELGGDLDAGTRSAILHAKAFANIQVGEYEQALLDATESIQLEGVNEPNAARTYGLRARINNWLGNYEDAIADATQAIEIGSADIAALNGFFYRRAQAHYYMGDYGNALSDAEAALAIEETSTTYELIGDINDASGNSDAAITNYQQAIALSPDDPWLHNYLGDIYYDIDDMGSAETEYRAAIRLDDQVSLFHENLGYALREQERYDESIAAYDEALRLNPDAEFSYFGRGYIHYLVLNDAEAIADFEKALTYDLSPDLADLINEFLAEIR